MKKEWLFFLLSFFFIPDKIFSQNLFPVKLNTCETSQFCLDCGEPKAGYDEAEFSKLLAGLTAAHNLKGIRGMIKLQVLIDSLGKGCVLSHTDKSNNPITLDIIDKLNNFGFWKAAVVREGSRKSSVNLSIEVKDGALSGHIERVDQEAFLASFDHPRDPEIYNKSYTYTNPSLASYTITVWKKGSSAMPSNFSDNLAVDADNKVWYATDRGLVCMDGEQIRLQNGANSPLTGKEEFRMLATDHSNNVWVGGWAGKKKLLYKFDQHQWERMDTSLTWGEDVFRIINSPSGELLFCTDSGLMILNHGNWTLLNQKKIPELPEDDIDFAQRDKAGRLWIGTYKGSIRVDPDGKVEDFNKKGGVLKGACITNLAEDEEGVIYLGIYEYSGKPGTINRNEGLITFNGPDKWQQYTSSNSGMPFNHITDLLYDPIEKVLWIATDRAGLVRYDRKGNWENYHNKNSALPTSYISGLAEDSKGNIYMSTRYGMVRMKKE
ncbi:MAG TPA: hypothetical protein VL832_07375 [Puia sp.]|nr:hypothetical protein [Puia sp.]